MVRRRALVAGVATAVSALAAASCGSSGSSTAWAGPQAIRLGSHETCGWSGRSLELDFQRLDLERRRWSVRATLTNRTRVPLAVVRPHTEAGTYFGLAAFPSSRLHDVARRADRLGLHAALLADRFAPALPRRLDPGARWSGTISGPGRVPRGRYVRVVLGRFSVLGPVPRGLSRAFLCVSEHAHRLS